MVVRYQRRRPAADSCYWPGSSLPSEPSPFARRDIRVQCTIGWLDGAELGKAIAAHRADLEAALAEHEDNMFHRSAKTAVAAAKIHALCFADADAPRGLIELLTGNMNSQLSD